MAGKKTVAKANEFNQNLRRRKEEQKVQEEVMAQRIKILEEELAKSREENISLQSERDTWDTRIKSIEDRLQCYQNESEHVLFVLKQEKELISNAEQHARAVVHILSEKLYHFKIKEEARVAGQKKQEEYIQLLEKECATVKEELKEERKLVQMLKREIDEATQFAKKQTEETGKKLVDAHNAAADAIARAAAAAETKYAKAYEDLQEERKLVQMLKLELDKATQSAKKQAEETEQELVNPLNAAMPAITRTAAAEANEELQEEQKLVHMLKQEIVEAAEEAVDKLANALNTAENKYAKADEDLQEQKVIQMELDKAIQSAKKQTEETGQELVNALNTVVAAKSLADAAESRVAAIKKKHAKAKKELQEEKDLVQTLKIELNEVTQFSNSQAEEIERKLVDAAAAAEAKVEKRIMSTTDKV